MVRKQRPILENMLLYSSIVAICIVGIILGLLFVHALMNTPPAPPPLILHSDSAQLKGKSAQSTTVKATFSHDWFWRTNVLEMKFPDGGALVAHFKGDLPAAESSLAYRLDEDDGEYVIYQPIGVEYAPKYSKGEIDLRLSEGWYIFTLPTADQLLEYWIKFPQ